jgi:hypothetical protein
MRHGVPIPVIQPQHITAMKLQAGRPKDVVDLEFLLLDSGMAYSKARNLVKRYLGVYAAEELDRLLDELKWQRTRRRR